MSQTAHINQSVGTTHITATQLKQRGWTDSLILDLLGPPDLKKTNPIIVVGRR